MDLVIVAVFRVTFARHTDHLVVFFSISLRQIAVHDQCVIRQRLAHIVRIDKLKESLAVILRNRLLSILREVIKICEMLVLGRLLLIGRVGSVADGVVVVEIDVINAPVIRCQSGDHFVLLISVLILFDELFVRLFEVFTSVFLIDDLAL